MANAKINPKDSPKQDRVEINTTTLNIKEGDLIATTRGWKKAMCDSYLANNGVVCCEIKTFGLWQWMSYDQQIKVKR
jgi:hypothetical protein